jgi:hypothetical protein
MFQRLTLVPIALLGFTAALCAESQTKPTAADSPKGALRAQDSAAKSGDVDADMAFYQAEGEQQKKLAHAIADGDVTVAKLQKAVGERFGKDLAAAAVRAAGTEDAQAIEAATEHVDGDHATVQFQHQASAVPMVRQDGKWKVSLGEWTKGASSQDVDQLITKLDELAEEINRITDLVAQDKFRSGEGVRDRVQELHDRIFGASR